MKTTTKLAIAAAAMTGLLAGATARSSAATQPQPVSGLHSQIAKKMVQAKFGQQGARTLDDKHDCKGKNDCKGKGGCKTGDNGCKGKNSCKGKGGCKTGSDKL